MPKSKKKNKSLKKKDKKIKRYDLPEPYDIHFNAEDIVLRLVPEIDNLVEIAVYIPDSIFKQIKERMDKLGIKYELVDPKYIARRGRKYKATNIFIIGND